MTNTAVFLNQKRANVCEHTTKMASLFGKSFHFPFPCFVLFVLRYFHFHVVCFVLLINKLLTSTTQALSRDTYMKMIEVHEEDYHTYNKFTGHVYHTFEYRYFLWFKCINIRFCYGLIKIAWHYLHLYPNMVMFSYYFFLFFNIQK